MAEAKAGRAKWQALSPKVRYVVRLEVIVGETAAKRAAELDAMAADNRLRFVGTPEQLAAHLAEWHAAGACDGFDLLPAVMPLDLDLLVNDVVPRLRARGLRPGGYEGRTLREHLGLERPLSRFAA
jgi:alkanesulfonate monooxygenase SsuD/methylene tetrahydromethanopterin reductase-like flavin-dependent oxidoreductase (luciferase family)